MLLMMGFSMPGNSAAAWYEPDIRQTMMQTRFAFSTVIFNRSLLLFAATAAATVWANLDWSTDDAIAHPLHF
jgi:hypothetical protein